MGLSLEVGILSDLKEADAEGFAHFAESFARLGSFLRQLGLPPHCEPDDSKVWSGDMYGYSGLHYLRRLAAHVEYENRLPQPGNDDSSKDVLLARYYDDYCARQGFVGKLLGRKPRRPKGFNHLVMHSDAEGYYLPIDFADVLFPPDELRIPGGMVGSTHRLQNECLKLKEILRIPERLTQECDELCEAMEHQGEGEELWSRYGIECFSCVQLLAACEASLQSGAAIVFT